MKAKLFSVAASLLMLTACGTSAQDTADVATETTASITSETKPEVTAMTYEIDPNKPLVALTFDDGPNLTTTVQMLDVLEKHQVPGTFFLVGNNITPSTEKVVKRAYDMGCEIANHSKTHSAMTNQTPEEIKDEISFVSGKIEEITGEAPKFFRPPYIAVNETMYENIDMPFICGAGCNDWDDAVSVDERVEKTLGQVTDGTIILLHDSQGNSKTVEAIDRIIPQLMEDGYQFVTVEELFTAKGIEISGDDTNLYTVVG